MRTILKDKVFRASLLLFVLAVFVFLGSNSFLSRAADTETGPPCAPPNNCITSAGSGGTLMEILNNKGGADASAYVTDLDPLKGKGNIKIGKVEIDPAKGNSCIGATFNKLSATTSTGIVVAQNLTSYNAANSKCEIDMHVCTVEEMLRTTVCSGTKIKDTANDNGAAWVNGSPLTDGTADCRGWTNGSDSVSGIYWSFDQTTNGSSFTSTCGLELPFACCK